MPKTQIYPLDLKKAEVDENEAKTTLRQNLEKFLNGYYGRIIENVSVCLSLFSIVVYVVDRYLSDEIEWFKYVDTGIIVFYLAQYILELFAAQHRLHFFISTPGLVELITISPIFLLNNEDVVSVTYVRVSRTIRLLRIIRYIFKFVKFGETEVSQQIFKIFLTILTLILLTSGILEAIENSGENKRTYLHTMVYFTVVTLSTVGYGDVVPETELGRLVVMILIMTTIVLIPQQTNELIRLMGMQSIYARAIYKANSEVPHIIVTGHVGVPALKNFCMELFHPDHGNQDKNAVILQQNVPSVEMESFFHNPQYELFLTYLQGNPMLDKDLRRAVATRAKACVLLTNKYVSDSYSADHKNILTGLAIKKYVHHNTGENTRLIMQLIKPESKTHFYSSLNMKSNDQLIVVEEIKMNLLAKSCFSPGIISMLSNLIASAGDAAIEAESDAKEWLKEYATGMGHEIYRTDLSYKFQGKKFSEVAAIVYNEFQGIIFGLELDVCGQTIIRLNPGSYAIPDTMENNIHVYMICEDKKVADQVATYEMSSEELANYHLQQNTKLKKGEKKFDKIGDNSETTDDDDNPKSVDDFYNNAQDENDLLETDYVLLPEPVNLMQVTMISIQDHAEIQNHIVVCGIHPSIYYFLLPLRASYLKELQYVVILSPEPPTNEMWDCMSRFPKIIYIKGSPLLSEDLHRANINFADKAVVLGHDISGGKEGVANDEMLDAESIFIYKAIKKCNKHVQIMIELVYSSNIEFLLSKEAKKEAKMDLDFKYDFTPLFAAGEVYISSIIDTLTSQAFYNPHIVTILQQILTGGKQSNNVIRTICDLAELKQSNLWQISVPEDYLNKTFGELFNYLAVERELIPLGLYRLPGASDNKHPYVYTNPDPSTKLTHRDKVFVLAANMPNDLLSGNIEVSKQAAHGPHDSHGLGAQPQYNSNTHLSFDKDKRQEMGRAELNRSTDIKKDKYKLEVQGNTNQVSIKKNTNKTSHQLDLENLNQNSATIVILEQINNALNAMQQEIDNIKENLAAQDEHILEKVKNALRQEVSTIGQ